MATAVHIPLSVYMETSYRPDREYIDGEVKERNVGKTDHARMQALIGGALVNMEQQWGVLGGMGWRTRVSATRVRVPDLAVVSIGSLPDVLTEAPLLVVEILSPDDSYTDTQRRAQDYLQMGVHTIWIIDPETRSARQCVDDVWTATLELTVPGTPIRVALAPLFARLNPSAPASL